MRARREVSNTGELSCGKKDSRKSLLDYFSSSSGGASRLGSVCLHVDVAREDYFVNPA